MTHFAYAALFLAASFAAQPAIASCEDGEMVIKFSHVVNTDRHPKGIAARLLAERVNAEMDGLACMQVFGQSLLYTDEQVLEAMLQGDVQMAAPSFSLFESFTRQYRIFDLPFMFANISAVDAFQSSEAGQAMKEVMVRRGIRGLEFWHNGMKQMSANVPLLLPSDAEGLKIRIQPSEVLVAQMEALGALPQSMAFAEVYGALEAGIVDGQENTWSNIYGQRFFEVQDGILETNHGIIDYLVVTSEEWWQGLDPQIRDQLATILSEVTIARNAASEEVNNQARQAIINEGGEVRQLSPEQRAIWVAQMLPVWDQYVADVGQENIDAAQEINARY